MAADDKLRTNVSDADIVAFVREWTGAQDPPHLWFRPWSLSVDQALKDDLLTDYRLDGDDAFEFIEGYAKRFDVDLSGYWHIFHHHDEGYHLRMILRLGDPCRRVQRIPVSVTMLRRFANEGRWEIDYPRAEGEAAEDHAGRERRWVNGLSLFVVAAGIAGLLAIRGAMQASQGVEPC
ncbi:MAG: DUF1493 family protein [Pseudomonadota bacterium]